MGVNDPQGGAIFEPRGMILGIYVKLHIKMMHAKYRSFGSCGVREEDFTYISYYKTMTDNDAPGAGLVSIPGARFAGFIKRSNIHCYTQNILKLLVLWLRR